MHKDDQTTSPLDVTESEIQRAPYAFVQSHQQDKSGQGKSAQQKCSLFQAKLVQVLYKAEHQQCKHPEIDHSREIKPAFPAQRQALLKSS